MASNSVSYEFVAEKLAGLVSSVNHISPASGDASLTAFDIPYAYYTLDVTATPAPRLCRGRARGG